MCYVDIFFRFGAQGVKKDLQKSTAYYEYLIQKSVGKLQSIAAYELSEILENNAQEQHIYSLKKHDSLTLLIMSANEGYAKAQHKLSVIYASGVYLFDYLVPMDAAKALMLEHMAALSGFLLFLFSIFNRNL
jgi:TPR repeat protein